MLPVPSHTLVAETLQIIFPLVWKGWLRQRKPIMCNKLESSLRNSLPSWILLVGKCSFIKCDNYLCSRLFCCWDVPDFLSYLHWSRSWFFTDLEKQNFTGKYPALLHRINLLCLLDVFYFIIIIIFTSHIFPQRNVILTLFEQTSKHICGFSFENMIAFSFAWGGQWFLFHLLLL